MNPFTAIAIYLTLWWTVLFAVLPLGAKSHAEVVATALDRGGDPASPVNPRLKEKFLLTTVVSAGLFLVFYLLLHFGLIQLAPVRRPG